MNLSQTHGENQRITSNRSRELHTRTSELGSSVSDVVPIVNNRYCMWLRSEKEVETRTEAVKNAILTTTSKRAGSG